MSTIFQANGKYFKEEVVNDKLRLVEVQSLQEDVPPKSSAEVMVDAKIANAVAGLNAKIDVAVTSVNNNQVSAQIAQLGEVLRSEIKNGQLSAPISNNILETCELHDAGTFEYEAEKWRWMGQSGLVGTRQYSYGGPKAYHRPFDISYNPMNIHTHANYMGLQGMAELVLSMNGYYLRTRHNDYRDYKPHSTSSAYQAVERIARPSLPSGVTGTVANQRTVMQDFYTRLYNTLQENANPKLSASEKALIRWDMAYAEIWWETLTDGVTTDPGNNTRHLNVSNDVKQMLRDAQYYNYGGHKDRFENTGYWLSAIKEVDANGNPSFAVLKFRILMQPVATLADYLPSQMFDDVHDYAQLMRGGFDNFADVKKSSWGRFKLKEGRDTYGVIDTLINKIPGLDNGPGNIAETYTQYGATESIANMTNSGVNNAARYFRYSYIMTDASGRDYEKRGFNDPYLFVAMTTQSAVKKHTANGRDYRFSYMIPLEMVLRHPLEVWNPYGIPEGTVAGSGTAADPYTRVNEDYYWYLTPTSFFDQRIAKDSADTVKDGLYFRGADGVAYATQASGTYIFLPGIVDSSGNSLVPPDGIRVRWPCYPCFHEGSYAFAQIQAMRDYLIAGKSLVA
jgi:hypothetical protein